VAGFLSTWQRVVKKRESVALPQQYSGGSTPFCTQNTRFASQNFTDRPE
jgi:hypothetical protein